MAGRSRGLGGSIDYEDSGELPNQSQSWDEFIALLSDVEIPDDFLGVSERGQVSWSNDPFAGWNE
jgi:hypothetical protein